VELCKLAGPLGIPPCNAGTLEETYEKVFGELNRPIPRLMILDNLRDAQSLKGIRLPRAGGCRILITSRYEHWSGFETVPAVLWSEAEAVDFVLGRTTNQKSVESEGLARELVREFDTLPLALEVVTAFLVRRGLTLSETLAQVRSDSVRSRLLAVEERGWTNYPNAIAKAWLVTEAVLTHPFARVLVKAVSFLAPHNLTPELLSAVVRGIGGKSVLSANEPESVADAVAELVDYSLLRKERVGTRLSFSVHRMLQEAVRRDYVSGSEREALLMSIVEALNTCLPYPDYQVGGEFFTYLCHEPQVVKFWDESAILSRSAADLFLKCAQCFITIGAHQLAERYLERATRCMRLGTAGAADYAEWFLKLFQLEFAVVQNPEDGVEDLLFRVTELLEAGDRSNPWFGRACFNLSLQLMLLAERECQVERNQSLCAASAVALTQAVSAGEEVPGYYLEARAGALYHRALGVEGSHQLALLDQSISDYRANNGNFSNADMWNNYGATLHLRAEHSAANEQLVWLEAALVAFEQALQLKADNSGMLFNVGQCWAQRSQVMPKAERVRGLDRAIQSFEQCLSRTPDDQGALNSLVKVQLERWEVTASESERQTLLLAARQHAVRFSELDPLGHYSAALVLALTGEYAECLQHLTTVFATFSDGREEVSRDRRFQAISTDPRFVELILPFTWNPSDHGS
jgi:tetratricopeptide (TPR) repeat protein